MKKRSIICFLSLIMISGIIAGCSYGGNVRSPSPALSPIPANTAIVSPDASQDLLASPGLIADNGTNGTNGIDGTAQEPIDNDNDTVENAQSAQLEMANTLSAAAKSIAGVQDAAVVVTDDKRCVVALQLKSGTKLNNTLQNKITAANVGQTEVRVTADKTIYEKIKELESQMLVGKSVSFEEVKDSWDKIQMVLN